MAPVSVDPDKVREFKDFDAFYRWLADHHDQADEVWIKIHKVSSGLPSITPKEAIDACLCWGWIDAIRKGLDERSYLQRYTMRGKKSIWSQINVDNVARLTEQGLMTEHGLRHVAAAKADGRWQRAYKSGKDMTIPDDLKAAIDAEPAAKAMLKTLSEQNRFALALRVHNMKTETGRRKKIETFVAMLKRGETIYPQGRKAGSTPMAKAVLARIRGRVQGVGFRYWTQEEARALGLSGWVRNEPDGSVTALIAGREDAVAAMLEKLRGGPQGAKVTEVAATPAEAPDPDASFRITR